MFHAITGDLFTLKLVLLVEESGREVSYVNKESKKPHGPYVDDILKRRILGMKTNEVVRKAITDYYEERGYQNQSGESIEMTHGSSYTVKN